MARQEYIVPPRFTLPMRERACRALMIPMIDSSIVVESRLLGSKITEKTAEEQKIRRTFWRYVLLGVKEALYILLALVALDLAFHVFENNNIYKVVSVVVAIILWSNVASSAARHTFSESSNKKTDDIKALHASQETTDPLYLSTGDTTGYLVALKRKFVESER